jgi:flagellar basal body-associated protein FliL
LPTHSEDEKKDTAGKDEKKAKKRKPLLLIAMTFLLVFIAAGLALFFFAGDYLPFLSREEENPPAGAAGRPRYEYAMREFQVNLADTGNRRFLRTTIDLAYNEKSLTKEIEARESEIRSEIIAVLRSKFAVDLDEPGGMKNLEADLINALNSILESGKIEAIYYKDFIFQ